MLFILYQLLGIGLTVLLVSSGADWQYYLATRQPLLLATLFPAAVLGFIVPIVWPAALYLLGLMRRERRLIKLANALATAAIAGLLLSFAYKAFTGRPHPELFTSGNLEDISRVFHFGWLRGGVFWGWPSSHTTVAFALASAWSRLSRSRWSRVLVWLFALYVGVGVSATIHWLSDFIAGAIFGTAVGAVIGERFKRRSSTPLFQERLR